MRKIILLAIFICFYGLFGVFAQTKNKKVSIPVVKLNRVHRAANSGSADEYKVVNIILLGFKNEPDDWVYVFHLKDERTGLEIGRELTKFTNSFLLCTDKSLGKVLDEQKNEWLNRKINLYFEGRDYGLTPFMNVGFITKIELLDDKGKIVKALSITD